MNCKYSAGRVHIIAAWCSYLKYICSLGHIIGNIVYRSSKLYIVVEAIAYAAMSKYTWYVYAR